MEAESTPRGERIRAATDSMVRIMRGHHRVIEKRIDGMGIHHSQHRMLMRLSCMGRTASQKDIAQACRLARVPFMVVTQMLASMADAPVPTRAEVSDIFNAVADGAAAVMVTNETAVGHYPAEVIRYLAKTAAEAEKWTAAQASSAADR